MQKQMLLEQEARNSAMRELILKSRLDKRAKAA